MHMAQLMFHAEAKVTHACIAMPVPRWESLIPNLVQLQAPKAHPSVFLAVLIARVHAWHEQPCGLICAGGFHRVCATALQSSMMIALTGHPNPRPSSLCKVLLMMWTSNIDLGMQVEMLELFSGDARVSQVFREAGKSTVSYDIQYDPKGQCMNFLSPGGFA